MKARLWLMPVAAGLAGFGAGHFVGRNAGDAAAAPPQFSKGPLSAATSASSPAVTLDDLRRVVREELAARGASGPSGPEARVPEAATVPDAAQTAAATQASQALDVAIAKRTWTEADAQVLQDQFMRMAPEQRIEWLRQFAVAVNQGRLVPQTDRIPF
jgi:hypothetical protein